MINSIGEEIDERDLQRLYKSDPQFRILMDFLFENDVDEREINLDDLAQRMWDAGITVHRNDVLKMLRTLEGDNRGWVWLGRRNRKTRFSFHASPKEIAEAARKSAKGPIAHTFRLRPDLEVSFELPIDLTQKDVKRIADFLRTLPFDNVAHANNSRDDK